MGCWPSDGPGNMVANGYGFYFSIYRGNVTSSTVILPVVYADEAYRPLGSLMVLRYRVPLWD